LDFYQLLIVNIKLTLDKEAKNNETVTNTSTSNNTKTATTDPETKDKIQKLEEIEKIEDPVLKADEKSKNMPKEYGYKYNGPEPTRYSDWEIKGKCVDF